MRKCFTAGKLSGKAFSTTLSEVGAVERALSEIENYLVDVAAQETAAIAALEAGSHE